MDPIASQQSRAERLIAVSRVVLAAFSLFAVWLDPSEPTRYAATAYGLLITYGVYAVIVAGLTASRWVPQRPLALAGHCLDLAVAALVMFFTEGAASPFFTYFVFALVAGTLRWHGRGALWTGVAVLVEFAALGFYSGFVARDPDFELNRSVIRGVYLVVVAVLLWYLGHHEAKLHSELGSLAAWPRRLPAGVEEALGEALSHAAATLGAARMAMAWEESEEPWLYVAVWSEDGLERHREPPGAMEPLVAEPLADADFFCGDASRPRSEVVRRTAGGLSRWRGEPLHPALRARLRPQSVLSLVLAGESFAGRLFALDKKGLNADDLTLGRVVAHQVAVHVDQVALVDQLRAAAAREERIRLARDLHDGVVQSLAAAGLKLEAAQAGACPDSEVTRSRIREVQALLAEEQRSLRAIAGSLAPALGAGREPESDLAAHLEELVNRIRRYWGLAVELHTPGSPLPVPGHLAHEACRLVHEGLVNAVRHGAASTARVEVAWADRQLRIRISDDGGGFPFRGDYELAELEARGIGPAAIRDRVRALGGTLRLESGAQGARLEICLPESGRGA